MKTHAVKFTRSLSEDIEAATRSLPRVVCPGNRHEFLVQLRAEFNEATTHGVGSPDSAFHSLSLSWGSMAEDGDTYTILAEIDSILTAPRLRAALQGLFDRGMAGQFEIVPG